MNRRDVLKGAVLLSASMAYGSDEKKFENKQAHTNKKNTNNPRIVVVGGGWA
ncbi:MAG TPA: NAD(P)/FAD-dependent oxidoreductase, partial [Epsilonproteobacteria bacterium]|nr:NAD(P)/FAD-dependent oxidoreductase [Campylobacterota bacterium]